MNSGAAFLTGVLIGGLGKDDNIVYPKYNKWSGPAAYPLIIDFVLKEQIILSKLLGVKNEKSSK